MMAIMAKLNQWFSKRMFFVVSLAVVAGFLMPLGFSSFLRRFSIGLFAYMTFALSLTFGLKSFLDVLRRPWVPLYCLLLVHLFTPLLAWLAGTVFFGDDPQMRLGFLVAAAIPAAVTSIMWTSMVRGNVPLTIMTVNLDTFFIPVILPLFFWVVAGQTLQVDYGKMFRELLWMVTIPSLAGMLFHDYTKGRFDQIAKDAGGLTSKIALFLVIFVNGSAVAPYVSWSLNTVKTLVIVFIMVAGGYGLGYLSSFLLPRRSKDQVSAMIYSVGMRNNAFGLVLALSYFSPRAAIPITFAMLFQQPLAGLIYHLLMLTPGKKTSPVPKS